LNEIDVDTIINDFASRNVRRNFSDNLINIQIISYEYCVCIQLTLISNVVYICVYILAMNNTSSILLCLYKMVQNFSFVLGPYKLRTGPASTARLITYVRTLINDHHTMDLFI